MFKLFISGFNCQVYLNFFIHAFIQSETIAVIIMKLAHRPRIASNTITLISKSIYCLFFINVIETIQPISAGPNPHPDTGLSRERSVAMTTSSRPRPVKLHRRDVKDRRQLTFQTTPAETGCFIFWQLSKVQRFNLLTIKG